MNITSGTPTWIAIVVALVPIILGVVTIAAMFVAFVHWVDRIESADSFAADHIPENEDVAAIEAALPEMRDHAHGRRSGR